MAADLPGNNARQQGKYHGQYKTVPVAYYGGLQYPHLVRIKGTPDYLDQIIKPIKA